MEVIGRRCIRRVCGKTDGEDRADTDAIRHTRGNCDTAWVWVWAQVSKNRGGQVPFVLLISYFYLPLDTCNSYDLVVQWITPPMPDSMRNNARNVFVKGWIFFCKLANYRTTFLLGGRRLNSYMLSWFINILTKSLHFRISLILLYKSKQNNKTVLSSNEWSSNIYFSIFLW